MDETKRIRKVIKITNAISPTFCLAKWYHSNIYLHTGQTHSCYHPRPHDISLQDIKYNPSALHNTIDKKLERLDLLKGKQTPGCQYCWNVENLDSDHISDRMIRNDSIFFSKDKNAVSRIVDNNWDFNINPEYVEIAFSNECNFKCGYCHPVSSSSFQSEIKQHGAYPTKNHAMNVQWLKPYQEDKNPYIEAWWKWWPELSKTLNILRITGGEPLMHKSTWQIFDKLRDDPKPNLELNINSNLGVKTAFVERLAENVNDLLINNKIKQFKLFSSLDTWGDRAEYIRTGLDLSLLENNLDMYITKTHMPVTFMCTFNILSVTSFIEFLKKILEWRKKYNYIFQNSLKPAIRFDTPYLKEPLQYDIQLLPKDDFLQYFDDILKFIDDNTDNDDITKFTSLEYEKFRRVRDYFATVEYDEEKLIEGRIDFYKWFTEYDKRRDVNFLETFPEMKEFWELCKEQNNV